MPADLIDQLTSDPDFLSLSEAEQDAMYEELSGQQAIPKTPSQRTESLIAERGTRQPFQTSALDRINPLRVAGNPMTSEFLGNREAILSAPVVAMAQGRPQDMLSDLMAVLKGQRRTEFGDVARSQGASEGVAATAGFVANAASDPLSYLTGRGVGAGAKSIGGSLKAGQEFVEAGSSKQAPIIASRIRDAFGQAKKDAGEAFGKQIDDLATQFPDRRVSLRSTIDNLNKLRGESPKLASDLASANRRSGNTLLSKLLNNPELADDLSVAEAQQIKQSLQKVPSVASKSGKFGAQFSDTDLDVIEAINDVRASMLESFPELESVFANYGKTISKFKNLKGRFKVGSLIKNVRENFTDPEVMKEVQELLPPSALNDIRLLGRSMRTRGLAKQGAIGAAGTGALGLLLKYALAQKAS